MRLRWWSRLKIEPRRRQTEINLRCCQSALSLLHRDTLLQRAAFFRLTAKQSFAVEFRFAPPLPCYATFYLIGFAEGAGFISVH
jgi:hypothetical protein